MSTVWGGGEKNSKPYVRLMFLLYDGDVSGGLTETAFESMLPIPAVKLPKKFSAFSNI
jgi:hypothetical protein